MARTNNWLYENYKDEYIKQTGITELEQDEKEFLSSMFNAYKETKEKEIYYDAVYKFKRGYPRFLIFFEINKNLKKAFIQHNAPISLVKAHKVFARRILIEAQKAYCKVSD